MKRLAHLLLLTLLSGVIQVHAATLAETSVNTANNVINDVIDAYGGADALNEVTRLAITSDFKTVAVGQSRKPGPPFDKNHSDSFSAIDTENNIFVNRNKGSGGGFVFENGTIINGEQSYQINYRGGTAAPIAEPDFNTTSGPFVRVTPVLLVKQLMTRRQTSHWLGVEEVNGRPHDVVTLVMEVGPGLSLYFDQETHKLNRMERVLPGFGVVEYRFLNYEMIAGIPFNRKFELYLNGDLNLDIDLKQIDVNANVAALTTLPETLSEAPAVQSDNLNRQQLADGVYLIGGTGTYALFVEMEDYVVAVGGTAGIPERIASLREVVPDKPIRFGVLTHHHNDHVLGVPAYVAESATILTVAENEQVVRNTAGEEAEVALEFVKGQRVIDDGQRLEIHDIGPTPHAEHLLVAWLPDHGILFEADHFPQPQAGPMPPANPVTIHLAEVLASKGWDVKMIVGAHSRRKGSMSDMEEAITRGQAISQN